MGRSQFQADIPVHLKGKELGGAQKPEGRRVCLMFRLVGKNFAYERVIVAGVTIATPLNRGLLEVIKEAGHGESALCHRTGRFPKTPAASSRIVDTDPTGVTG